MARFGQVVTAMATPFDTEGRVALDRTRKLLLHRHEIARLAGKVAERGLTLVPLSLYWKEGRAKVELALARGKKTEYKRVTLKRREHEREMDRARRRRR